MIRDIIDNAVQSNRQLTITYSKDGIESNIFHLSSVAYSPKFGNNYIVGKCYDYHAELTFKVEKVINAEIEWVDVLNPDIHTCQDGLYIIAERGDMCLGFPMKKYKKEEWLRYVTDVFFHDDDVLAYHFIPFYDGIPSDKWTPFICGDDKVMPKGKYVFAVSQLSSIVPNEDCDINCGSPLMNNGIYYCHYEGWYETNIKELKIPEDMKVLAYHHCTYYNEDDHSNHWELARKMGLIK